MRFACWITKATKAHSEYVILIFHGNKGYANAPQCYFIGVLPVLLKHTVVYTQSNSEVVIVGQGAWGSVVVKALRY